MTPELAEKLYDHIPLAQLQEERDERVDELLRLYEEDYTYFDDALTSGEREEFNAELMYAARLDQRGEEMVDSITEHWWRWFRVVAKRQANREFIPQMQMYDSLIADAD